MEDEKKEIIIPKVGDWVAVEGYNDAGKIWRIDKKKKSFGAHFPAEEGGIEEWCNISLGEIEYIIKDPKEVEFFEKELEK